MADGKPTSRTGSYAPHLQFKPHKEFQSSRERIAYHNYNCSQPDEVSDTKIIIKAVKVPSNGSDVQREEESSPAEFEFNSPSRDWGLEGNEPTTMLKSPTEGSTETTHTNSISKRRPFDTASTSSAPRSSRDEQETLGTSSSRPSAPDERSEVDFDVQVRPLRARERIVILRRRVLRTRQLMKKERSELHQPRENAQVALDKLMRKINENEALGRMQEDLQPIYQSLRDTQDVLGPIEYSYGRLESQLDDEEQDLEEEEDHFYRHYSVNAASVADSGLDDVISPLVEPHTTPEKELQNLDLNSGNNMVQGYLDKLAEAGRFKEDLEILEEDYYQRSTDASFRKQHDIALSTETATFLAEYPNLRSDILEKLHIVEDDIFDLRDKCLSQGLFTDSDYIYEPRDALYEDVMSSVYDARDRSPLRIAAHEIKYDERETDFEDKREYVNNWLLQWIQDSAYESLVLKTWIYFKYPERPEKNKILEGDKWSDLAIENWDTDSAGKETNENTSANRLDAIAGETGRLNATTTGLSGFPDSLGSLDVDPGDGEIAEGAHSTIEAGSHATQTAGGDGDSTPQSSPRKEKKDDA